jgi:DNA topoisomerase VI subunit B
MSTALLQPRQMFERSRDAEFFDPSELQKQTGQPRERFVSVVLKELLDNACDACEMAGVAPCLMLVVAHPTPELVALTVQDNGVGLAPATVQRILNFATRTSDKAAYRSPTRGAQGNALKTVLGIPFALGSPEPVVLESHGVRHRIGAALDPAGELHLDYTTRAVPEQPGTGVTITVPADALDRDPTSWGQAFALFNPHASVKICRVPEADLAMLTDRSRLWRFLPSDGRLPRCLAQILPR